MNRKICLGIQAIERSLVILPLLLTMARRPGGKGQAPFAVRRTTLLPPSLRDELVSLGRLQENSRDAATAGGSGSTSIVGRKQRRKAARQQPQSSVGARSAWHKQKPAPSVDVKGKQRATVEPERQVEAPKGSSKKRKRATKDDDDEDVPARSSSTTQQKKVVRDARTPLQKLLEKNEAGSSKSRRGNGRPSTVQPAGFRSAAEEHEDAEIAWLEYKLGMTGRKEIQEDGLDGQSC